MSDRLFSSRAGAVHWLRACMLEGPLWEVRKLRVEEVDKETAADLRAARRAKAEPGSIPFKKLRKELAADE